MLHMHGSSLTVIPADFTNYKQLCVDSVGKQTDHETKQNRRNRDLDIVFIFRIDEIRLYSCGRL